MKAHSQLLIGLVMCGTFLTITGCGPIYLDDTDQPTHTTVGHYYYHSYIPDSPTTVITSPYNNSVGHYAPPAMSSTTVITAPVASNVGHYAAPANVVAATGQSSVGHFAAPSNAPTVVAATATPNVVMYGPFHKFMKPQTVVVARNDNHKISPDSATTVTTSPAPNVGHYVAPQANS